MNQNRRAWMASFACVCLLAAGAASLLAQVYPSAATGWIIPGGAQDPTDPETLQALPNAAAVTQWEALHADLSTGGGGAMAKLNPKLIITAYIYLHGVSFQLGDSALRAEAVKQGVNYEDLFIHFKEDTILDRTSIKETKVAWCGWPLGASLTTSATANPSGVNYGPGSGVSIFSGQASGGAFYLAMPERFDEADFTFTTPGAGGSFVAEVPTAVDATLAVTAWAPVAIVSDGTSGFSKSGALHWMPPAAWKWGAPWGKLLGYKGFYIRLRPTGYTTLPILDSVRGRSWVALDTSGAYAGKLRMIGWDPANDRNGDGYVDDTERANLANPNATARFRHEARVNDPSGGWVETSSECNPNFWNPNYASLQAKVISANWAANGIVGAYNDNAGSLLAGTGIPVLAGGHIAEALAAIGQDWTIQDPQMGERYSSDFVDVLGAVRTATGSTWMGGNFGYANLFSTPVLRKYAQTLDWFLLEFYNNDGSALAWGPFCMGRSWDLSALAYMGKKTMPQCGINYWGGLPTPLGNTKAVWERSRINALAQFYLKNIPGFTYLNVYNPTGWYGSGNTVEAVNSYYKAGVPKNYAYQPWAMLGIDIGQPSNKIPGDYVPMPYVVSKAGNWFTQVVGRSTSTVVNYPPGTLTPLYPTYVFYLATRSDPAAYGCQTNCDPASNDSNKWPSDMVLARQYTRGLVAYRTSASLLNNTTAYAADSNAITVDLPKEYRLINYDGSLQPRSAKLTLRGLEGAVLLDPDAPAGNSPTSPELVSTVVDRHGTLSFKPQPASAGSVTLTVTLTPSVAPSGGTGAAAATALSAAAVSPVIAKGLNSSVSLAGIDLPVGAYDLVATAENSYGISYPSRARVQLTETTGLGNVRVYPNPWRQDHHADQPIRFSGVGANARVKIFTASGHLVRDFTSAQDPAVWWLDNKSGAKVASGVYLYQITSDSGAKARGKLAIIH